MDYIMTTEGLTKMYGSKTAAKDINIHIREGEIYGLIGRNGAGKTTVMRMLSGLSVPTSGSFTLFGKTGKDVKKEMCKVGVLIEHPGIYPNMSATENLKIKCIAMGIKNSRAATGELLDIVGLSGVGDKAAGSFSLGMRQRLGIALALVGNPKIIILDEPINGLDPKGIVEIRELLLELKNKGKTIFISSHILGELEKIATCYGIISAGRLVEEITAEQLKTLSIERTIITTDRPEQALETAKKLLGTHKITLENGKIYVSGAIPNIGELTSEMFRQGIAVTGITNDGGGAEEYFLKKMEEGQS